MKTARFIAWISIRLEFICRFIEARDCDFHAVLLWRSLVAQNADSHTPDLARQLGRLGNQLSNLNRHEESLRATEESITLYRSLVEKNPASYTLDLTLELCNLGVRISNLNRRE